MLELSPGLGPKLIWVREHAYFVVERVASSYYWLQTPTPCLYYLPAGAIDADSSEIGIKGSTSFVNNSAGLHGGEKRRGTHSSFGAVGIRLKWVPRIERTP